MSKASDKDRAIYHLIVSGDDLAFARFCDDYYDQVHDLVRSYNHGICDEDETLIADVVTDVFLKFFREPGRYKPEKQDLVRFLVMDAEGDLKNEWEKRKRRYKKYENVVELEPENRKSVYGNVSTDPFELLVQKEAGAILEKELNEVFNEESDRALAHLMLSGERRSEEYVRVLAIGHLSVDEQRKEVKKHKDRIDKVIRRRLTGKYQQ